MPTFNERGLVPSTSLVVPEATAPVHVSSGDSRKEEEEEEDEEHDWEADTRGEEEEGGRGDAARDQIAYDGRSPLHGQGQQRLSRFSGPIILARPRGASSGGAVADSEKDREAFAQAVAAREVALKDAEAAKDRCRSLKAELETARRERAKEARGYKAEEQKMKAREDAIRDRDAEQEQLAKAQATERGRLEELEEKLKAEKAELEAKAKVLAEDREAFKLLEVRSRTVLRSLYEKG
nr:actin cytoskeleton-regulatory complex protein pan1-like [Aegilops tauschii subsp. strangulata]